MAKIFNDADVVNLLKSIASSANEIMNDTFEGYINRQEEALNSAEEKNREIVQFVNLLSHKMNELDDIKREEYALLYSLIGHMQKLKYDHDKLINFTRIKNKNSIRFTHTAAAEMEELFQGAKAIYSYMNDLMISQNPVLFRYIFRETNKYELISRRYAIEHEERLSQGLCPAKASSVFLQILDTFEDILWHLNAVATDLKQLRT